MVKLHLPQLDDIEDDMEFCLKLAKEEFLILVPGKQPNGCTNGCLKDIL